MSGERICRPSVESLEPRKLLTTFTVTTLDNAGAGSLRQAMLDANANDGADVIDFNIAATTKIIRPLSQLPAITEDLTINGTGLVTNPAIEINGKLAGATANGLRINGGAVTIKGLAISSFQRAGIYIKSSDCIVQNCRIGTDLTGKLDRGNKGAGIVIDSRSDNVIGGTLEKTANIIAFNGRGATGLVPGVLIFGGGTGNAILGNSIFSNRSQGIDIVRSGTAADGINPADLLDPDTGTNKLQNQPFVSFATVFVTETHIVGTLRAAPNTTYRLEFFNNPLVSTGGVAGRTFLDAVDSASDANGNLSFSHALAAKGGGLFTVTATDPGNNTSEFSLPSRGVAFGNVTGTVYNDANGDGTRQSSEVGVPGVLAFVDLNRNGTLDAGESKATTNGKGKYTISNVLAGPAHIRVLLPPGIRISFPTAGFHSLTLPSANQTNRNFGLSITSVISGFVFQDNNTNDKRDTGDTGLVATVFIDADNDGVLDSNEKKYVTTSSGAYTFKGLAAGKYVVRVATINGFAASFPSPAKQTITLAAATVRSGRNFGFVAT